MTDTSPTSSDSVRARLLKAALECFLSDEYHNVTTRQIANKAGANVAMIRYYFGSKEGLYEEMFRETMSPLLDILDTPAFQSADGFGALLRMYYETMTVHPEFPKLILRVLALNKGPGKRFILQLIERGRSRGARRVGEIKGTSINPSRISLAPKSPRTRRAAQAMARPLSSSATRSSAILGPTLRDRGCFVRWTALQLAYVESPHFARCALPANKTGASETAMD